MLERVIKQREKLWSNVFQQVCVLGSSGKRRGWSSQENGQERGLSKWAQNGVGGKMWWKVSEVFLIAAIFSVNQEIKSPAQSEGDKVGQRSEDRGIGMKQLSRGVVGLLDQRNIVQLLEGIKDFSDINPLIFLSQILLVFPKLMFSQ